MNDDQPNFRTAAVLGLGLLGGSFALAAKQRKLFDAVIGWSNRESTRELAREKQIVDVTVDTPEAACAEADLVLVCVPVESIPTLLERIAPHLRENAVVTDVGSTKRTIVSRGEKAIRKPRAFVGSHPMAGSEKSGLAAARVDLFDQSLCILTPTDKTDAGALSRVESMWRSIGCRTTHISPGEHDRLISDVSHLPHALAAALVAMQDEKALPLAGKGFRDTTRVAAGDPALWRDIFLDNSDSAIRSVDRLSAWLREFRTALQAKDAKKIETMLHAASERRRQL